MKKLTTMLFGNLISNRKDVYEAFTTSTCLNSVGFFNVETHNSIGYNSFSTIKKMLFRCYSLR